MEKIYEITNTSGSLQMREHDLVRETKHHLWLKGESTRFRKHSACRKFIRGREDAIKELSGLLSFDLWTYENKLRKIEDEAKAWGIEL